MKPRHAAAFALVLSACAASRNNPELKGWVGQPESKLIASWGAPDETATLADGGKIDTWTTGWEGLQDQFGHRRPMTCRKMFTIDANGTVSRWKLVDCPAQVLSEIKNASSN
jgi:hypothetical protein